MANLAKRTKRRGGERAAADLTKRAKADPVAVAYELSQHRDQIQGAYALVAVLLRRLGGDVQKVEAAEIANVRSIPFSISIDPNGDVTLTPE